MRHEAGGMRRGNPLELGDVAGPIEKVGEEGVANSSQMKTPAYRIVVVFFL
jgi:hypothetical protein